MFGSVKKLISDYLMHDDKLYGMDMSEWHFLGRTEIKYTDTGRKTKIAFFLSQKDDTRKAVLLDASMKTHGYWCEYIPLWEHNELSLYVPISEPSKWLKNQLFEKHGMVWSIEKNWWIPATDQSKYEAAKAKQKKGIKDESKVKKTEDDKIITLNFTKQDKIKEDEPV